MNEYEMVLIVDGSTSEEDAESIAKKITAIITDNNGSVVHFNKWGRRKLAYEVRKKSFGYYFVVFFKDDGKSIKKIHGQIAIDEFAIKCLIIKCDDIKKEQEFFLKILENPNTNSDKYQNYQQKV